MDGHQLVYDLTMYTCIVADGGPRGYRRRGVVLPEKYLPGRFLAGLRPEVRADVVRAVNTTSQPAPWALQLMIGADAEPRVALPEAPIDRRWSTHGRWAA